MKLKVGALVVTAFVPSVFGVLELRGIYRTHLDGAIWLLYGAAWLLLFAYTYGSTPEPQRKKLWWLAPLLLCVFPQPMFVLYLALELGWAMSHGAPPP